MITHQERADKIIAGMNKRNAINPEHYKRGGYEAVDVLDAYFPHQPHLWTAGKYLLRLGRKDSETQEVGKTIWFLLRYLQMTNQPMPDMEQYNRFLGEKQ